MSNTTDRTRFNHRMDELVAHVIREDVLTPEFREQYVKATGLYRRVAEYDVDLAWDLFVSTMMFSYTFGVGVTSKILKL